MSKNCGITVLDLASDGVVLEAVKGGATPKMLETYFKGQIKDVEEESIAVSLYSPNSLFLT